MNFDPEAIPRRNFGDLAKLANAPSPTARRERDEGSGLIHLAALEAAEGTHIRFVGASRGASAGGT